MYVGILKGLVGRQKSHNSRIKSAKRKRKIGFGVWSLYYKNELNRLIKM